MSNKPDQAMRPRGSRRVDKAALTVSWLAPLLLMLVIFVMSSEPSFGESDYIAHRLELGLLPAWLTPVAPFLDRYLSIIVHLGEYGLLALLLANALHRTPGLQRHTVWTAWLLAALFGISDEWHQSFVPGRNATWQDLLTNTTGAGMGAMIWLLLVRSRRQPTP
jgi:VanZ family protein